MPAGNTTSSENAYCNIRKEIKLEGIDGDKADVKRLVKTAMEKESSGSLLLVVDNADDEALLFGTTRLSDHVPFSRRASILLGLARNATIAW